MGLGGISPWSLVLILAIVLLLFGTKKLKGLGGDLGSALKGFKKAMSDEDAESKKVEDKSSESEPLDTQATKATADSKEKTDAK